MPFLNKVRITFNTHNENRDFTTVLHVFVKNRSNTSADPESKSDYIGNLRDFQRHRDSLGHTEINPYLAYAKALSNGVAFENPSSHTFDLTLRAPNIPLEEIILPVVNIHIMPSGNDRWIFDYTLTLSFSDGKTFSFSSNINGVKGIILDQDNRNHSGVCTENPFIIIPPPTKPVTNALLTRVILEFGTHNDNKNKDTKLNVHIVNRINAHTRTDIAIGLDILPNTEFPASDPKKDNTSLKRYLWSTSINPLASNNILLRDMVLPEIALIISSPGNDRWIFDYRITFEFTNIQTDGFSSVSSYSSTTHGIVLDNTINKYTGVYRGHSFPNATPPTAVLRNLYAPGQPPPAAKTKRISLSFLQKKLDEFLNSRQGGPSSDNPPMVKMLLHNSGAFPFSMLGPNGQTIPFQTLPESYFDVQALEGICGGVEYVSNPVSLGQLYGKSVPLVGSIGDLYFNNINSKSITLNIDINAANPTPLSLKIDFDCSGLHETIGGFGGMNFTQFYIVLKLTLVCDKVNHKIDIMNWVTDIKNLTFTPVTGQTGYFRVTGNFLGKAIDQLSFGDSKDSFIHQVVDVQLHTDNETWDPDGTFKSEMTSKIYDKLITPDLITRKTIREGINSTVNTLLLGGVVDDENHLGGKNLNNNVVNDVHISGDDLIITYSGPQRTFNPPVPADWPNASTNPQSSIDFSPGKLANIDHIVVLALENRSFDHMLGYLSLPVNKGGMGRTDVDGLKGGESNPYKGKTCNSFPLTGTCFTPDPPHGYEPVHHAINSGKMDGFANSYGEEHGDAVAANIMGYHTGANVPVYDALVRDFALSHRWFASHPGSTFCNRFFELTGRLNLDPAGFWEFSNSSHIRPSFTKTIFDHLTDYAHITNGLTWKYFEQAYCFLRFFENFTYNHTDILNFNDPVSGFLASAKNGTLPSVSFIDPHYIEFPPNANCDGPPADIKFGQDLVKKIVEAVVTSPNWSKTMLIVTYDEHGGFYDHVPPPPAIKVSSESPINTYGVRVPAFIISPWVSQGKVVGHDAAANTQSLHFDHTSILKTIAKRFMSDYPPYMGARYAAAKDLGEVMEDTIRHTQFLPFIRYNMVYNSFLKSLDVRGGSTVQGTMLWLYDVNDTPAQHFSFEDAGDGFFYIRTHRGNLYVTVNVPQAVTTGSTGGTPTPGPTPDYGIKQDIKYHSDIANVSTINNPAYQKWKLSAPGIAATMNNISFVITNAFFPNKVLRPINNATGATVVLGAPDPTNTPIINKNTWKVTSPLISTQVVVTH